MSINLKKKLLLAKSEQKLLKSEYMIRYNDLHMSTPSHKIHYDRLLLIPTNGLVTFVKNQYVILEIKMIFFKPNLKKHKGYFCAAFTYMFNTFLVLEQKMTNIGILY